MLRKIIGRLPASVKENRSCRLLYASMMRFSYCISNYTRKTHAIRYDRGKWKHAAQNGEFRFHLENEWRQSQRFTNDTKKLLDYLGFNQLDYEGKTVIDLGAGSKLRTKYFTGARLIVIEPLASRFMREIKWCDLAEAERVYSTSGEEHIAECVNTADLVISINVLDHCYDFEAIIENIASYLKEDGLAFLSFDKHNRTDEMHPLILTETTCESVFRAKRLITVKHSKGAGEVLQTYGSGDYCLNYWLKKA